MPRQTNFSSGEIAPLRWGRTDMPGYATGLRVCRNFFVSKEGAAVSRPGSQLVNGSKYETSPDLGERDVGQCRLIPFIAADSQSYVLEFGLNYVRFHTQGGTVESAPGVPYEVTTTPYEAEDLFELRYAQVGDVLTITCPRWDPFELRRLGHTNWTFSQVTFANLDPWFTDPDDPTEVTSGFQMVLPDAWVLSTAYVVGDKVRNPPNLYECIVAGTSAASVGPTTTTADEVDNTVHWKFLQRYQPETEHPAREWQWMQTVIGEDLATGARFETTGQLVSELYNGLDGAPGDASVLPMPGDNWPVYADMPITLRRQATSGLLVPPTGYLTWKAISFNLYRGRGEVFGWVASTKSREFVDVGDEPDYSHQPPVGTQPFGTELEDPAETRRHKDRPTAVAYFQQKRVFGGATRHPARLDASKTNDFFNFDSRIAVHVAGEALQFELATMRREEILHLLPSSRLAILTNSSAITIAGVQGSPLDFDSVDTDVVSEVGSTHVPPLMVRGVILFPRAMGEGVEALTPEAQGAPYSGQDVTDLASHLFVGRGLQLVDWTFARVPWGIVWAVRADGQLLSLTYHGTHWGWARHDTDGVFESVCAVPEGDEHAVYTVVVREDGAGHKRRLIERMTSRVRRGGAVSDGSSVTEPPDDICLDSALQYFGGVNAEFVGLEHLEGKDVWLVLQKTVETEDEDGETVSKVTSEAMGPFTVREGGIELDDELGTNLETPLGPRLVLNIGLKYTPELETLDIANGEARLRKKIVERVGFEVDQTRGVSVGQDFQHLDEFENRGVDDSFNTPSAATALVDMPVDGTWDQSARAVLRQTMPLPVTVVGLTREVGSGD